MSESELDGGSAESPGREDGVTAEPLAPPSAAPALGGEREGLPRSYRMRADTHYVDQLAAGSAGQPVRMVATAEIESADRPPHMPLELLIQSIRAHGVVHPLLVRRRAGRYALIAGGKRLAAARLAGLAAVPCLVHQADDVEAESLARADNLSAAGPAPHDPERLSMFAAVRQAVAHHLTTVQAAASVVATGAPAMRRAALDLIDAHAWRAARMLDGLDLIANAPVRAGRGRSLPSVIDRVIDGFSAESRLSGVALRAELTDGVPALAINDDEILVGLAGAVLAVLPIVEHVERPAVSIRLRAAAPSVVLDVTQTGARVPSTLAQRFFDPASSDRPGGWCALAGALAAKTAAERHGGSASFESDLNGGGSLRIQLLRRV